MAVSREDALGIGKEIADRVIRTARGCRCGIALWDARGALSALHTIVTFEESKLLQPLPQFMTSILAAAQKDCGVGMTKAMELSQRLEKDIKEENWTEAQVNHALLKGAILGPLKECSTGKE